MDSTLLLFDSKSRLKKPVHFPSDKPLGIYVCGPTVYDHAHVGHARSYIMFDVIVRLLRHFGSVCYVRNYTDIDDKIITKAKQTGQSCQAVAEQYIASFQADMALLGVAEPDVAPRVTEHLPEIIALITELLRKDAAYQADGDVYFAVDQAANYGQLSHRSLEDMQAGARVEVSANKRHPMDFVLWKGSKPGEPSWNSPFGAGRPGWHIECSAMAKRYLGLTFAIHGGGQDLMFPHHENEIAQSETANGCTYAHIWLHNGLLVAGNQKMSKSLGNGLNVQQLCEQITPEAIRLFFLSHHYRSNMQFDMDLLKQAEQRLQYMYQTLQRADAVIGSSSTKAATTAPAQQAIVTNLEQAIWAALADDVNTAKAIGYLSEAFRLLNETLATPQPSAQTQQTIADLLALLKRVGIVLGLLQVDANDMVALWQRKARASQDKPAIAHVEGLVAARQQARADKDFVTADKLRKQLQALGVVVQDSKDGVTWTFAVDHK